MQERPDLFKSEKNKNNLGPAYETRSSFEKGSMKGMTFGAKRQ